MALRPPRLKEQVCHDAERFPGDFMFQLTALEKKLSTHDQAITGLINAIRQLTAPPTAKRRGIGFVIDED